MGWAFLRLFELAIHWVQHAKCLRDSSSAGANSTEKAIAKTAMAFGELFQFGFQSTRLAVPEDNNLIEMQSAWSV